MQVNSTPRNDSSEGRTDDSATKKHIRGSSLLLVGRMVSLGLNLAVQVLLVRYLVKSDFGAFAYAITMVALGTSLTVLGLDKTFARFGPIYHEQGRYDKLFGVMLMSIVAVAGLGLALVVLVIGLQSVLTRTVISDSRAVSLLLVLIILTPLQALGCLFEGMLAVFVSSRAIFFRRHVLGPSLKLAAVLLVIWFQADVIFLAIGYLAAGIIGTVSCALLVGRLLVDRGWSQHFDRRNLKLPIREIFGFSLPLLSSEIVFMLRITFVIFLLGVFHESHGVADFRAVLPVARLNRLVFQNFQFLFTPIAARLFAKEDRNGIVELYWQTAAWIAVLSFPIFAVTFALAQPLTVLMFGPQYADSGPVLAILSLGYFFHASLGFNCLTLRVFGRVRHIFLIDLAAALVAIATSLLLIPHYGALGGAAATCLTLILHNVMYQVALVRLCGVWAFPWGRMGVYGSILLMGTGLLTFQLLVQPPIYAGLLMAALGSLLVIVLNFGTLEVGTMFPELRRFARTRIFSQRTGETT